MTSTFSIHGHTYTKKSFHFDIETLVVSQPCLLFTTFNFLLLLFTAVCWISELCRCSGAKGRIREGL
jgi:hypothetical protein